VQVRRDGRHFNVLLDGHEQRVDAALIEPGRWSLLIGSSPVSREVRVRNDRRGQWTVLIQGAAIAVTLKDAKRRSTSIGGMAPDEGPAHITAPMPGKIVRLLVAPGDAVEPGQGVVVVEAMKMENELRAPRAGRVLQVSVREGTSVEAGTTLLVIG
jgi:biotin carboxyl carrier protein